MAATAEQIARLRRMVAELTAATYTDAALATVIETYPLLDEAGLESDDDGWVPAYDLHAAAADIWEEKAAEFATSFNFSADGTNFQLSQKYEQMMKQVLYHRSRRSPRTGTMVTDPDDGYTTPWIRNYLDPNRR